MGVRLAKLAFAICAPLVLMGCILTPGKFVSNMTINADRTFTFTYKGEVIAIDPSNELKGLGDPKDTDAPADEAPAEDAADGDEESSLLSLAEDGRKASGKPDEDTERKRRAIAEALSKEAGYRAVSYQGDGKFLIDYAISGTLSHNFIYPFNMDAEIIFPFIVVEVRNNGTVRMRAPGYANDDATKQKTGGMGGPSDSSKLDGVFTLDTNAEIVSQNNEEGAKKVGARSVITWRATPLTKDAPTAVLRMTK